MNSSLKFQRSISSLTSFHSVKTILLRSAECGLAIGELTLAQLHLDLYHDELKELQLEVVVAAPGPRVPL